MSGQNLVGYAGLSMRLEGQVSRHPVCGGVLEGGAGAEKASNVAGSRAGSAVACWPTHRRPEPVSINTSEVQHDMPRHSRYTALQYKACFVSSSRDGC